jgi:hypothetical protein
MGKWAQQRRRGSDPLGVTPMSLGPQPDDWFLELPPNGLFADLQAAVLPPGVVAWQSHWGTDGISFPNQTETTDANSFEVVAAVPETTYHVQVRWMAFLEGDIFSPWSSTKVYVEP